MMNFFILVAVVTVINVFISLVVYVLINNKQPLKLPSKHDKNELYDDEIDYEQVRTFVELQNIINYDGTGKNQLDLEAINKYYGKD